MFQIYFSHAQHLSIEKVQLYQSYLISGQSTQKKRHANNLNSEACFQVATFQIPLPDCAETPELSLEVWLQQIFFLFGYSPTSILGR